MNLHQGAQRKSKDWRKIGFKLEKLLPTLRDLHTATSHLLLKDDAGSTPSRLSPFSHDHVLLDDAWLTPSVHMEVDSIATSIMQWT
ncbi:hypothetical protein GOP47_0018613 [Adiantum capillus-veneris]|uniref:Uncharacterized protein n=1 Tax=Adiantum capillus-veneris TaxID=13818 RepID=A0A9D4UDJ1_ADICA|nr:hypothetical protein GOP47_0018613 [Adiantum capillus-veneris]